jgi:hypothetical protein
MGKLLRYILLVYLAVYFFTAFFWRSYRVWKATGINPFVLGRSDWTCPGFVDSFSLVY